MLPFSKHLMTACLSAMRALCLGIAALLVLLILTQYLRGDANAAPQQLAIFAGIMAGFGVICGMGVRFLTRLP